MIVSEADDGCTKRMLSVVDGVESVESVESVRSDCLLA